ncbi:MAG: glutamate--tRNA ligase [Oscillospiraceae bacterium]|jgi:glutamyl-tRNA synthetase|nr:glutamate--tRNA ligase [Oscillospiraceae bacterium]
MDTARLADLLYPDIMTVPDDWEERYPPRDLPEGARVTRFAPSPTGFVTIGNILGAMVDEHMAHSGGGVFYLRVEDTDAKRTVDGGVALLTEALRHYGLTFDESDENGGDYGPYSQRARAALYQTYAKELTRRGLAYPCFCTGDDLTAMRAAQEAEKANFGYYGRWTKCRGLTLDEIEDNIKKGLPFVLRIRCPEGDGKPVTLDDPAKGRIEMPANDIDHVLLKSDGIPTYHFAHAVDDHLMRTTHVVRGDEWIATYPLHHMLFDMLGFKRPHYIHIAPLMKMDGGSKRKISKRKDPELALSWYAERGYPAAAVREYLMTLLNSNFEDWRRANPSAGLDEFPFSPKKMNAAGALFDIHKLDDVSKNVISRLTASEAYAELTAWAERNDEDFHRLLVRNPEYSRDILSIGRGGAKPRKDITRWDGAKEYLAFFFDELFIPVSPPDREFCGAYAGIYDPADGQDVWFQKIKDLGERFRYCPDVKQYKTDPAGWKGSVADASASLRLALTGRESSPDMYAVMRLLGADRVRERVNRA